MSYFDIRMGLVRLTFFKFLDHEFQHPSTQDLSVLPERFRGQDYGNQILQQQVLEGGIQGHKKEGEDDCKRSGNEAG